MANAGAVTDGVLNAGEGDVKERVVGVGVAEDAPNTKGDDDTLVVAPNDRKLEVF